MTALAARPPIARAAATAAMMRIGTNGFIVPPGLLGAPATPCRVGGCGVRVESSRCRYRLAQCRDEPIHPVSVTAVEPVGQQQIGRASCRERGSVPGGGAWVGGERRVG